MMLNDLREQISSTIINSHLPIDAIYFVLKDILKEVEQLYYIEVQKENEKNKKEEENKEPENK